MSRGGTISKGCYEIDAPTTRSTAAMTAGDGAIPIPFQQVLALTIPREEDILTFVKSLEHVTKSAVEEGVLKPST